MDTDDAPLRAHTARILTEHRLHTLLLDQTRELIQAQRYFQASDCADGVANVALTLVAHPALIDAHDYIVHGVLTRLFGVSGIKGAALDSVARDSRARLARHGAPYADVRWNNVAKRYEWRQLEIVRSEAKGGNGLRARTHDRFSLPYLGVPQSERKTDDRYVMEIHQDYRSAREGATVERFMNADPSLWSALVPVVGDTAVTRVGLFGLAIAGMVNEPARGEQINLVPCSCGFSNGAASDDARETAFHMDIVTPLGVTVHVPVYTMLMSILGVHRASEFDAHTELLTVYSLDDFRSGIVEPHAAGLSEDTNVIVRDQPLPRLPRSNRSSA